MTIQETVEYFKEMVNGQGAYELCLCDTEHMEMTKIALDALEKQIPQGISIEKLKDGTEVLSCPNCNIHFLGVWGFNKYCRNCGQRLE